MPEITRAEITDTCIIMYDLVVNSIAEDFFIRLEDVRGGSSKRDVRELLSLYLTDVQRSKMVDECVELKLGQFGLQSEATMKAAREAFEIVRNMF